MRASVLILGLIGFWAGWALSVAWVASYRARPAVSRESGTSQFGMFVYEGSAGLWVSGPVHRERTGVEWEVGTRAMPGLAIGDEFPRESIWNRLGFYYFDLRDYSGRHDPGGVRCWVVPVWLVIVAAWLLPARAIVRAARRERLRSSGRCARCGYDMRASPEQCPECGAPAGVDG